MNNDDPMERQLSCSVCLELFTDPVLLPCLHSLCRPCVEKLTTSVTSQTFKCPECNSQVSLGASGYASLKRNFPLSSMVAIYKQSRRNGKFSQSARTLDNHPSPTAPDHRHLATALNQDLQTTLSNQGQQTTYPYGAQQAFLQNQMMQGTLPYQAQQTIVPNQVMKVTLPYETQQTTVPSTCSTCDIGQTSQAHIFCETCNISFCKTCRGVYHPDDIGHTLKLLEEPTPPVHVQHRDEHQQCTLCDPASPSTGRVRCLECQMSFCDSCLHAFHPTTNTTEHHTLVEVRPDPPQVGIHNPEAAARWSSEPMRNLQGSISLVEPTVGFSVVSDLAQFAVECTCNICQTTPPQTATVRCLDCSANLCSGCVGQHQSQFPNHSLMDISLSPETVGTKRKSTKTKPAPRKSVNVQLEAGRGDEHSG
ncbi:E3 ubiquitin-protein ligase TRIM9-like isoform X2 [Haliotis rubra]|uniref:E3 ubiquitin-protein ligase TRIM9-like isoform X2 n=1 Tax=Haliotis rubra TaxID=36100 RepID=UPI001EE5759E|nr:E3 ubiquitin-protein ligase TRIM9-like isoform X2 [Haliotis rubra]